MPLPEKALIRLIRDMAAKSPGASLAGGIGIGDDCAVVSIPPGHQALVTTDFSLENIHFRTAWHPADSVGHRCLTRGLSDIAAMGGQPLAVFLSLALPGDVSQRWVRGFLRGFLKLADEFKVALAGGDTAESSGGIMADVVVLGSVPKGKAVRRSGARPGDRIYVSGELGASAAALDLLARGRKPRASDFAGHFYPTPRVDVGSFLRQKGLASAMIDLSDGLSTDVGHICDESGTKAELVSDLIPLGARGTATRAAALNFALHGGDDYELLFTAPPGSKIPSRIAGVPITAIGRITRARKMFLRTQSGAKRVLTPKGWEHFREK